MQNRPPPIYSNTVVGGSNTSITLQTPEGDSLVVGAYIENQEDTGYSNPFAYRTFRYDTGSSNGLSGYQIETGATLRTYDFAGGQGNGSIAAAAFAQLKGGGPFIDWRREFFSTQEFANVEISGPDADPDNDLFSNLAEYALGLNPIAHDHSSSLYSFEEIDGERRWIFQMQKYPGRRDVSLYLKRSSTLEPDSWSNIARIQGGGELEVFDGATVLDQSGSDPELLRIQHWDDSEQKGFYRWHIELDLGN